MPKRSTKPRHPQAPAPDVLPEPARSLAKQVKKQIRSPSKSESDAGRQAAAQAKEWVHSRVPHGRDH